MTDKNDIEVAYDRGVEFLNSLGSPRLIAWYEGNAQAPKVFKSPWSSAVLLDVFGDIGVSKSERCVQYCLDELTSQVPIQVEWKFIDDPSYDLVADSDDTAMALIALARYRGNTKQIQDGLDRILEFTNEDGYCFTWMSRDISGKWLWHTHNNEVDVVVNANIFRLSKMIGRPYRPARELVLRCLESSSTMRKHLLYYDSPAVAIYFLSKALASDTELAPEIRCKLTAEQLFGTYRTSALRNPLNIALATTVAISNGVAIEACDPMIQAILASQQESGGWLGFPVIVVKERAGGPYVCVSESLTTVFCLEALSAAQGSFLIR